MGSDVFNVTLVSLLKRAYMIINDIVFGIKTYFKAIGFIFEKKLAWFFLFPLAISIVLLITGLEFSGYLSDLIENKVFEWIKFENQESAFLRFLQTIIKGTIWIISKAMFFFIFAYTGGYIVLIILSPVLAWLSEKSEKKLTGADYPFKFVRFVKDVWRGIVLAIRNFLIEMFFIIAVFLFSFIPVLGWLSGIVGLILLFFISAYFYGFSFIDYYIERKKLNAKQSVYFMRKHKGLAIGNGALFAFTLLFPVIGTLLAPFLAIISVVAATITMEEMQIDY